MVVFRVMVRDRDRVGVRLGLELELGVWLELGGWLGLCLRIGLEVG
jgi:hypothetical protein